MSIMRQTIVSLDDYERVKAHTPDFQRAIDLLTPAIQKRLAEWFTGSEDGVIFPVYTAVTRAGDQQFWTVVVLHRSQLYFMRLWDGVDRIEISQDGRYGLETMMDAEEIHKRQLTGKPLVGEALWEDWDETLD